MCGIINVNKDAFVSNITQESKNMHNNDDDNKIEVKSGN